MVRASANEIVNLVQAAVRLNVERSDAIDVSVVELGAGAVPREWLGRDRSPELIRETIRRAEAMVERVVELDRGHEGVRVAVPNDLFESTAALRADEVWHAVIEHMHGRLNASWSYVDVVEWEPLITFEHAPVLYLLTLPLGKPHKGHKLIGEEHNLSGIHFHYANLDGKRSDILFAFGDDPPWPNYPVKWERHGTGKAKFRPQPENWNFPKRENINLVCCSARDGLPADTRFFRPSKGSRYLLP